MHHRCGNIILTEVAKCIMHHRYGNELSSIRCGNESSITGVVMCYHLSQVWESVLSIKHVGMLPCYHLSQVWESAIHKRCRNVTMLSPVTGVGNCYPPKV